MPKVKKIYSWALGLRGTLARCYDSRLKVLSQETTLVLE